MELKAWCFSAVVFFMMISSGFCQNPMYQKKVYYYKSVPRAPHGKLAKVESYSKKMFIPVQVPSYEFGYKIHDPQHKNYQEKTEIRAGDSVQGFYSVLQPNGVIQLVRYHSDDSGFHSRVSQHKSGDVSGH